MSSRRRIRSWIARLAVGASLVALLVALPATVAPPQPADAAVGSNFNAGRIIDDAVFYNSASMNANGVQNFLNSKVASCRAGFTCLKDYRQNTDNRPADKYCNGYTGRANESAAQIIDNVARSCGISQQVLLVLLEKEQSLVSSTAPSAWNYQAATGQGCPDTAPCDGATAGFFYQVYYGARQYEIYRLNPNLWGYQAGRWNNILYHPDAGRNCGSARVYIENQATAALYIYTPYTPNGAALNNLYGTGDNCSSYGNRNFWRMFTDWFGSTHVPSNPEGPFGNVEAVTAVPGGFQVSGWAADPNTAESIMVHVYAGASAVAVPATTDRADVAAAYPALGGRHGFSATVPVPAEGSIDVCVYGINLGAGANSLLGCTASTAMAGAPVGVFEGAAGVDGGVSVSGWAIDPDTAAPMSVHVYVDDQAVAVTADADRADVGRIYPAYGANHAYSRVIPATPGRHTVCVYGMNTGIGANVQYGCREVVVPTPSDRGRLPIGNFEGLSLAGAVATASGWAIDPDTVAPIPVRLEATGARVSVTADAPRNDVSAAYPAFGANHGFVGNITLSPGPQEVCAYAVNTGAGGDTKLGCRTVVVPLPDLGRAPLGNFEAAVVKGSTAVVSGWALDLDTADPISVHIYVANRGEAYTAGKPRGDVGAIYPLQGANHGFVETVSLPPGYSEICVYAINNGTGGHTYFGCRGVQVADHSRPPVGVLEAVAPAVGAIDVSGWAFDPDTTDPITVHVYLDGVAVGYRADSPRADVAAAYRGAGDRHGFGVRVPASPGNHTVCVYPINDVPGVNAFLGCRTVTVG